MENHLKIAEVWARLLDDKFSLGPIKFGIDPILDLIPGAGDVIGLLFSLYLIFIGFKLGLPTKKIFQMIINILIDFVIGIIPFVGAIGDVFFKSNKMNLKILKENYSPAVEVGEVITKKTEL